mgnify:CR=1 FL=1
MSASDGPGTPLDDYFAALQRLALGKPKIVKKGIRITNDAVALEAGRGKGSIKKSRAMFAELILAIDAAAKDQNDPKIQSKIKLERAKSEVDFYRKALEAALGREVSLVKELYEVKQKLRRVSGGVVVPLRRQASDAGETK